jgi:hypothetical protein
MSYLRYLCLFAHSGVQHLLGCVFVLFLFVLCTLCCQFFCIVYFGLPLWYSLTFIKIFVVKISIYTDIEISDNKCNSYFCC